jgi:hypothetical protein
MRRERINILFGGLAGFISIAFLQLLSVDITKLSLPLTIAIFLFAVSLPLSIFYVLSANEHLQVEKTNAPFWYGFFAIATIIAGFAGIAMLFYSFGKGFAIIFSITSFIVLGVFNKLDENKDTFFKLAKKVPEKKKPNRKVGKKK